MFKAEKKVLAYLESLEIDTCAYRNKKRKSPNSNNPDTKPMKDLEPNEKREQYQKLKGKKQKEIKEYQNQVKEYDNRIKQTYEEEEK